MNSPQRVDVQPQVAGSRFSRARAWKKAAIVTLATFIVVVMIVWFGFLGWGVVTSLQWLMDTLKAAWPG
jgi:type VI protein secretion system component VasF